MSFLRKLTTIFLLVISLTLTPYSGSAATMTVPQDPPKSDPELERLKKEEEVARARKAKFDAEKAAAEAEKEVVEAKLATVKAKLGLDNSGAQATAPSGNITTGTGDFIETRLLAEITAREAGSKLAQALLAAKTTPEIKTLVIGNGIDLAGVQNYEAISSQVELMKKSYPAPILDAKSVGECAKDVLDGAEPSPVCTPSAPPPPESGSESKAIPPLAVPGLVSEAVKTVADLINLFRTDTSLLNQTVEVTTQSLATYLVSGLRSMNGSADNNIKEVYYPALYPPRGPRESPLLQNIDRLRAIRGESQQIVAQFTDLLERLGSESGKNKERIAKLKKELPANPSAAEEIKNRQERQTQIEYYLTKLEEIKGLLESYNDSVGEFLKLLTITVNEQTRLSVTAALIRAEALAVILNQNTTYVLNLDVIASGTTRTQKRIIGNTRLDHTGGVTVKAQLFDHQGQFVHGFSEDVYIDHTKPEAIREMVKFQKPDKLAIAPVRQPGTTTGTPASDSMPGAVHKQ